MFDFAWVTWNHTYGIKRRKKNVYHASTLGFNNLIQSVYSTNSVRKDEIHFINNQPCRENRVTYSIHFHLLNEIGFIFIYKKGVQIGCERFSKLRGRLEWEELATNPVLVIETSTSVLISIARSCRWHWCSGGGNSGGLGEYIERQLHLSFSNNNAFWRPICGDCARPRNFRLKFVLRKFDFGRFDWKGFFMKFRTCIKFYEQRVTNELLKLFSAWNCFITKKSVFIWKIYSFKVMQNSIQQLLHGKRLL